MVVARAATTNYRKESDLFRNKCQYRGCNTRYQCGQGSVDKNTNKHADTGENSINKQRQKDERTIVDRPGLRDQGKDKEKYHA